MITIYHNPRCSKSRETLALVESLNTTGAPLNVVEYLKTPPTVEELEALHRQLGRPVRDMLRDGEEPYKALNLARADLTDAEAYAAIAAHPILLQRPIVVYAARPPSAGRPNRCRRCSNNSCPPYFSDCVSPAQALARASAIEASSITGQRATTAVTIAVTRSGPSLPGRRTVVIRAGPAPPPLSRPSAAARSARDRLCSHCRSAGVCAPAGAHAGSDAGLAHPTAVASRQYISPAASSVVNPCSLRQVRRRVRAGKAARCNDSSSASIRCRCPSFRSRGIRAS